MLTLALAALAFAGCGEEDEPPATPRAQPAPTAPTTVEERPATEAPSPEDLTADRPPPCTDFPPEPGDGARGGLDFEDGDQAAHLDPGETCFLQTAPAEWSDADRTVSVGPLP